MAIAPATTAEVFELIRQSGIHPAARLASLVPHPEHLHPDPQKALGHLVSEGVLTRFQAEQLMQGRHRGFRMGPYVIQAVLGRGGMGAVYLAEHQELRRKVAIKVLVPNKDSDHSLAVERFLREARAAAALDHPNIVRIHDVCRHAEVPYLVMEYVEGQTLQQILDTRGTVSFTDAADYIAQAAAGLQHAYEKDFIHRDIKPANLMKDCDGVIKILDMGLARSAVDPGDRLTEKLDHGAVVGTADFIAPEQAMNSDDADIRADIYSLGATFFALVTGKPPFEGNTAQKLLKHQIADAPDISAYDDTLPEELCEVIATMLAKRPEDRYDTPAEVIAALAPWVGGSSRVLAGVTRTSAGSSGELQATIDSVAGRGASSGRVGRRKSGDSSVNPSRAARDTDSIAAAATTRQRQSTRRLNKKKTEEEEKPKKGKGALIGTIAASLLAAGAIAWVFGGGSKPEQPEVKKDDKKDEKPVAAGPALPNLVPADGKKAPAPVTISAGPAEKVLYKLDLTKQKSFAVRTGRVHSNDTPPKVTYPVLSRTGAGQPPDGWRGQVWNKDTRMEFFSDAAGGVPSIGVRNTQGPASAMLFSPEFRCPSGACKLKIDYSANTREPVGVRFKPTDGPLRVLASIPGTGTAWRVETIVVDLMGATAGFFEFHNNDPSPDAAVRLRAMAVTEAAGGTAPTPPPPPPPVVATAPPRNAGALYAVTFDAVPEFKKPIEQGKAHLGEAEQLPPHMSGFCWAPGATGEFKVEAIDGSKAAGLTNFTDKKSAQLLSWFEDAPGAGLTVGKSYVLRVTYRTANNGTGRFAVQGGMPGYTKYAAVEAGSTNTWKTVDVEFTRPEEKTSVAIDCTSIGDGNTLYIKSFEVIDPSAPAVPAPAAPAAAGPREVGVVHDLDFSLVPNFRKTVENGKTSVGGDEKLPPQVSGFCYAAGATGEFRCEDVGGAKALGFTNFTDKKSAQLNFPFENLPGGTLIAGKSYKVRAVYRTANDATGTIAVQGPGPDYKRAGSENLGDTAGKWKTVEFTFVRGGDPLALVIDNTSVGEGNTLYVRAVEVIELAGQ